MDNIKKILSSTFDEDKNQLDEGFLDYFKPDGRPIRDVRMANVISSDIGKIAKKEADLLTKLRNIISKEGDFIQSYSPKAKEAAKGRQYAKNIIDFMGKRSSDENNILSKVIDDRMNELQDLQNDAEEIQADPEVEKVSDNTNDIQSQDGNTDQTPGELLDTDKDGTDDSVVDEKGEPQKLEDRDGDKKVDTAISPDGTESEIEDIKNNTDGSATLTTTDETGKETVIPTPPEFKSLVPDANEYKAKMNKGIGQEIQASVSTFSDVFKDKPNATLQMFGDWLKSNKEQIIKESFIFESALSDLQNNRDILDTLKAIGADLKNSRKILADAIVEFVRSVEFKKLTKMKEIDNSSDEDGTEKEIEDAIKTAESKIEDPQIPEDKKEEVKKSLKDVDRSKLVQIVKSSFEPGVLFSKEELDDKYIDWVVDAVITNYADTDFSSSETVDNIMNDNKLLDKIAGQMQKNGSITNTNQNTREPIHLIALQTIRAIVQILDKNIEQTDQDAIEPKPLQESIKYRFYGFKSLKFNQNEITQSIFIENNQKERRNMSNKITNFAQQKQKLIDSLIDLYLSLIHI